MLKTDTIDDRAWTAGPPQTINARGLLCTDPQETGNALLSSLSRRSRQNLLERCESVDLAARMRLQDRGVPIQYAYFIESGAASVSTRAGDCLQVEIQTLGKKDFVGIPLVLGMRISPHTCTVQVPGTALRIRVEALIHAMTTDREVEKMLLRYVQATLIQSSQLVACNSRHSLNQRVARWLLVARDRTDSPEIGITHRSIAQALGVRRASITDTFAEMEAAGLIRRSRKHIAITNEACMAELSCNCHRVIQAAHENTLFGNPGLHIERR
ncbi:Crp/Fnr family transcriptional regulator [Bradyrhizobium sp. HKCCYLRH2060]|uniref:Crp/Fnr family transcriptional regulator n=1 Tax=Bradyrhizobium TaxID=374 RepID=UPI002916CE8C|nr:Crp/Fnr family transcriptional regulator [Bradyrhizobium sp. SZCCHNR3003]